MMKTVLRICMVLTGIAIASTIVYFFVTGTMLLAVQGVLMSVLAGLMVCELVREAKETGKPISKGYVCFFAAMGIFSLVITVVRFTSGCVTVCF